MGRLSLGEAWAFALTITVALAQGAFAVPAGFNIQGRLTDSTGVNRNGTYSIKFTIFDAPTGGNTLWSNTFPAIGVTNGSFQTILADVAGQSSLASVFASGSYQFLEIQVLGGPGVPGPEVPLVPREQLVSVPFAMQAGNAGGLASTTTVTVSLQGAERMRVTPAGNVGIGTQSPAYTLDVAGDINYTGTLHHNGGSAQPVVFGGLFYTNGSTCLSPNPATGSCSCPAGFQDSSYYVYQAGGINCGWAAGYVAQVPCYGQVVSIHQCYQ